MRLGTETGSLVNHVLSGAAPGAPSGLSGAAVYAAAALGAERLKAGRGRLPVNGALAYLLAGNATVTIVSRRTGTRFTYRVREADSPDYVFKRKQGAETIHFVKLLTGPDNETDYGFLGTIFNGSAYHPGRKSRISAEAPGARAFAWVFERLWDPVSVAHLAAEVEVFHEGRCGRCGRKLTVPESVASGYGPECAGRLGVR